MYRGNLTGWRGKGQELVAIKTLKGNMYTYYIIGMHDMHDMHSLDLPHGDYTYAHECMTVAIPGIVTPPGYLLAALIESKLTTNVV